MPSIRVLVVDDSVVVRRLVSGILGEDSRLEVVGTAPNGRIGLQKISQVNPDVVTLDIEMPEMDGLETLRELRQTWPRLPVIMFSALTERGAAATLEALALGASDYVTKPAGSGNQQESLNRIRDDLIPRIVALAGHPATPESPRPVAAPPAPRPAGHRGAGEPVEIVAIGVSTGGPNALAKLLPMLPADFPLPIVIVQHMPPVFTRFLAERLSAASRLRVEEARAGQKLEAGAVWIAPGNYHVVVHRGIDGVTLGLNQDPAENSCRPSVDVLFRSVAEVYGPRALGVVLTGMGQDGLHGAKQLRAEGSSVIVQDEASSVVWGMPGFIAHAGLADEVLPLDQMAGELLRRASMATTPGRHR
jgi:two-component system chemotaxis response regulator CheB